jgi:hypothetical protein
MTTELRDDILSYSSTGFNTILDKWCDTFSNNFQGGKMRGDRGEDIETFVRNLIHYIAEKTGRDLVAKRGNDDKKELRIEGTAVKKMHQVDVHIYLNGQFVAVVECKAYLDSCYYVRACDDFDLFRRFNYPVKKYIFTLEDGMDNDTKIFIDYIRENACDGVFYMMDGKRSSGKPVYDTKYRKKINETNMGKFIDTILDIACSKDALGF